jgi:hypothetical protein
VATDPDPAEPRRGASAPVEPSSSLSWTKATTSTRHPHRALKPSACSRILPHRRGHRELNPYPPREPTRRHTRALRVSEVTVPPLIFEAWQVHRLKVSPVLHPQATPPHRVLKPQQPSWAAPCHGRRFPSEGRRRARDRPRLPPAFERERGRSGSQHPGPSLVARAGQQGTRRECGAHRQPIHSAGNDPNRARSLKQGAS